MTPPSDIPLNPQQQEAGMADLAHNSDCALHNEPALPKGPCDCGAAVPALLNALRSAQSVVIDAYKDTGMETDEGLLAEISAAIAQATGEGR